MPDEHPIRDRLQIAARLLVLLVVTVIVYAPTLKHGFVYDDHGTIVENQYLHEGSHLRDVLTLRTLGQSHIIDGQRPVLLATMFADHALWGLDPQGYHATNIILHLACVTLLFVLAGRLGLSPRASLAAAALFALHPLASEAIAVPSFREDLLVTLLGFLFLLWGSSPRGAIAAPVILALALGAKESAVVLPLALGWVWWCLPDARLSRKAMTGLGVASAILVGLFLAHSFSGRPLQAADGPWNGVSLQSPANWIETAWLWWRFVGLAVWPHPLVADRIVPSVPLDALRVVAWLGLVGLGLWVLLAGRRRLPLVATGLGLALVMYLPVSNVPVPLFNPMADRYAYSMLVGFCLAAVAVLVRLIGDGRAVGRVVLVVLLACITATSLRLPAWRDDRTLWTTTLAQEPRSARAHTWLGLLEKQEGRLTVAREHFEQAEALNPRDVTSTINLAVMDGQAGDLVSAEKRLREAVELRPDKAEAWWNLAVTLDFQGRRDEATKLMEKTLEVNPFHPQAREALMPALPSLW